MLGGEIPDLAETPCAVCGMALDDSGDVVWDAWHQGERRFAALPLHRACAEGILPPATPLEGHLRCGLCGEDLRPEAAAEAFAALQRRFQAPEAPPGPQEIAWRLASREPRAYVAEHFRCILKKFQLSR